MIRRPGLDRRYWRLWSATGISSIGDGMVLVALPLLALGFTHSPLGVAGVLIAARLPALFFALPAGALADQLDRRRLVVTIELVRLAVVAALGLAVLAGQDHLALLYVAAFVLGGLTIAYDVVAGASLPVIVEPSRLVDANAHLLNAEMTGEEMIGQALGGAAVSAAACIPFLADAATFAASAALLRGAIPDAPPARERTPMRSELADSLRWFVKQRQLRTLTLTIATLAFCQAAVLGVLALYAREDLHLSSAGYGLLLAVASIGNVVGVVCSRPLHRRTGTGRLIVVAGLLAACAYPVLAVTSSALLAALALVLESAAVVMGNVAARSMRQSTVPDAMQGRAASAYQMVILTCLPLGGLAGGLTSGYVGIRTVLMVTAVAQLCVVAATAPRLAGLQRRLPEGLPEEDDAETPSAELPAAEVLDLDDGQGHITDLLCRPQLPVPGAVPVD